jgi:asparagine synthase (glutamine-hydrolysing)
MCGIFGFISHRSDLVPEKDRLRETAQLLRHRGPDEFGFHVEPGVALVHTRLSLLDLNPRSNQPFWDKTGRYCLVYNGEVYNFAELRAELEKEGVTFRTTSDTEVVLESLLQWGPDIALPKLEGMFAFAVYDRQEKSLLLARDRFGIKPLFVYETEDTFVFASEIRTMLPWLRLEPDLLSISSFLYGFTGPSKGFTFFKNVTFLDPGYQLTIGKGGMAQRKQFFALADFVDPQEMERLEGSTADQVVDEFEALLEKSVRSQLVADAPVGALCSGGIDSSVLLAIAAKHHPNLAIYHADVIGVLSEREAAARLSKHLKLDLQVADVTDQDFVTEIPEVILHYGHPFHPCPHSVPFMLVSRLIRKQQVKAVISGEGADEILLGYSYLTPKLRDFLRPRSALRQLKALSGKVDGNGGFKYLGLDYVGGTNPNRHGDLCISLHNRFEIIDEAMALRSRLNELEVKDGARAALESVDLLHYNLRSILHRNDTMGMSASIESRFPYLDSGLIKLAVNLPRRFKVRFSPSSFRSSRNLFCDKWILRRVGARYLPRELTFRTKRPFPVDAYKPGRLRIATTFLENSFVQELLGLSATATKILVEKADHELKWKLLQLEVWGELFVARTAQQAVADRVIKSATVVPSGTDGAAAA